jgi:hypothetical protein
MRPLTIWTLADRSRSQDEDSNAIAASKLFKNIASQVWKKDTEASLDRKIVAPLKTQCTEQEGEIGQMFANIEKLYTKDDLFKILGNKDLDRQLKKKLTPLLLSSEIVDGNKKVAANIHYLFNQTTN